MKMPDRDDRLWVPIPDTDRRYWVSTAGDVWSALTGRVLRPYTNSKGYLVVDLHLDRDRRRALVHHVVLEAYVGPRPAGMEACHRDDDKTDNRALTLRWDSREANRAEKVARRSHCPHGHPVDQGRRCATCKRLNMRAIRARRTITEGIAS